MENSGNTKIFFIQHNIFELSLFFSSLLILSIINFMHSTQILNHDLILFSGIASTMGETAETIKGFGRFLDSMRSVINIVSTVIGIEVIILLIAVSILSGALSLLGIPKGRFSFFCSLAIADMFWFVWAKSFNPESLDLAGKILSILKTNLILIIPFIIIYFFRSPAMSNKIKPKIKAAIKSLFGKKTAINKSLLIKMNESIQEKSMNLQRSIYNDVIYKKDADEILISDGTLKHRKELEEILRGIKREL